MKAREEKWVELAAPPNTEARWAAALERYGVEVRYAARSTGVPCAHGHDRWTSPSVPEWALRVMEATRPIQGGMRRRAVQLCINDEQVARAVQAAHRLGGEMAVWSLLCAQLYDINGGQPHGSIEAVHAALDAQREALSAYIKKGGGND